jgi:hypothetical protein
MDIMPDELIMDEETWMAYKDAGFIFYDSSLKSPPTEPYTFEKCYPGDEAKADL